MPHQIKPKLSVNITTPELLAKFEAKRKELDGSSREFNDPMTAILFSFFFRVILQNLIEWMLFSFIDYQLNDGNITDQNNATERLPSFITSDYGLLLILPVYWFMAYYVYKLSTKGTNYMLPRGVYFSEVTPELSSALIQDHAALTKTINAIENTIRKQRLPRSTISWGVGLGSIILPFILRNLSLSYSYSTFSHLRSTINLDPELVINIHPLGIVLDLQAKTPVLEPWLLTKTIEMAKELQAIRIVRAIGKMFSRVRATSQINQFQTGLESLTATDSKCQWQIFQPQDKQLYTATIAALDLSGLRSKEKVTIHGDNKKHDVSRHAYLQSLYSVLNTAGFEVHFTSSHCLTVTFKKQSKALYKKLRSAFITRLTECEKMEVERGDILKMLKLLTGRVNLQDVTGYYHQTELKAGYNVIYYCDISRLTFEKHQKFIHHLQQSLKKGVTLNDQRGHINILHNDFNMHAVQDLLKLKESEVVSQVADKNLPSTNHNPYYLGTDATQGGPIRLPGRTGTARAATESVEAEANQQPQQPQLPEVIRFNNHATFFRNPGQRLQQPAAELVYPLTMKWRPNGQAYANIAQELRRNIERDGQFPFNQIIQLLERGTVVGKTGKGTCMKATSHFFRNIFGEQKPAAFKMKIEGNPFRIYAEETAHTPEGQILYTLTGIRRGH